MGIYTNSFGETPEEQEKRRQHLYQVYDASVKKNEQQTAYKDTPQDQMTRETNNNEIGSKSIQHNNNSALKENTTNNIHNFASQIKNATEAMSNEYFLMHKHNYKNLDDYYHCKANYNATKQGVFGKATSHILGTGKEVVDLVRNTTYKRMPIQDAIKDMNHDLNINQIGRNRADKNIGISAQDACADFRWKNPKLPEEYW